jgi:protein involved in polysaccharide export with SLBB domain
LNHSVLLISDKNKVPFRGFLANLFILLTALSLAHGQIGGLGGGQQENQPGLPGAQGQGQGQGQGGATTPFPQVPERPKVNITNRGSDQLSPDELKRGPEVGRSLPGSSESDIEFQQYVASSLGYGLPIFGQNLFENVPSTFAPLDYVPVTPDYLIGPGDELLVRGWGQIDITNYRAVVDRNGSIYLPTVGTVSVTGVRYDRLTEYLKQAIGRYYKNFDLDVTLGRLRSIQVFVVGQVKRPGTYTVSSLSTLVNALFASGGPSKRGSMRQIQLKRGGAVITTFDLYDLIVRGDKSKDAPLMPGDVIYVPAVGRLVAIAGSVNVPAIYELKDRDTLGDVMGDAGGLTSTAAGQHAIIERIDDRQLRKAAEFPLTPEGLRQELQDGDIVRFLHISTRFENAVTLRGNVALPGRYPWREGMRVKDLIPTRESLVTEEFWKQQNLLGLFPANESFQTQDQLSESATPSLPIAQTNPGAAPTFVNPAPAGAMGRGTNPTAAPAGAMAGQGGQTLGGQNLEQTVGKVEAQRIHQEVLRNQIKRSAAEINWEYAVIQRLDPQTLTSQLLPFNLGKAIAGDDSQNLALQPGDVITIFSQADMQVPIAQQSKFVRLEGEFGAAGIYKTEPGETLRHLVTRVTNLTPQAYLFGSEFTRESVREDLQRRLDDYVGGLQSEVNRSQVVTPQDQATVTAQRQLVGRMQQLRSTGRIVLEVRPDADSVAAFPDMTLEDGDRLFVPFRPATVSVLGAVYNGSAFLYRSGYNVADYLRLAGGATRNGDKKHEFVLRANGATVSKQQHSSLVMNNFSTMKLFPGDTIIVPEKLARGAALQGFLSWAQLFSSFAIGAAGLAAIIP